ncbi:MAG: hypothetical protein A3B37_03530 [Candidatus Sungbacteria bacterium RIFCSPLOWO2_01_FULL_59_16]|uniref:Uncharacterized protein n=1 Tax=Candidatus Sungbacteria bacterium RIFCSPLOWO2_01_FULL_59_16 TaxID=1802280 RepID=A0A1G2LC95_9BACT|nr:MAG: hypothetical protein A3B37_03530 [Candidatus Sungbacteria bacterium RIFCSPLOWO2_01_FULL_59_16]
MESSRNPKERFRQGLSLAAIMVLIVMVARLPLGRAALDLTWRLGPEARASEYLVRVAAFLGGDDAKLSFSVGRAHHQAGRLSEAETFYRKALKLDPHVGGAHYQLARIYFSGEGDLASALAEINAELALHPLYLRSYYVRGLIHAYAGRLQEAEEDFKKLLGSPLLNAPNGWGAYVDLAWVHLRQERYQDALELMGEASRRFPSNVWIENALGQSYVGLERYPEARDAFQNAVMLANNLTEEEWLMAYPAHQRRDASEGIQQIKKGMKFNLSLAEEKLGEGQ